MNTTRIADRLDPFAAARRMAVEGVDFSAFRQAETQLWAGRWTMDLGPEIELFLAKDYGRGWAVVIRRREGGSRTASSDGFRKTPEQALAAALEAADRIFGGL